MALLTTSDATPNYGDGLCVLSALLFGVHKWRSETATLHFKENTQELVAVQLGTLAVLANLFEAPKYLNLLGNTPGEYWSNQPSGWDEDALCRFGSLDHRNS